MRPAPDPSSSMRTVTAGVDVGGTKIEIAVVDGEGTVLDSHREPTDAEQGPGRVLGDLTGSLRRDYLPDYPGLGAVGVGIAGQVDRRNGILRSSPNLKWTDVPIQSKLEDRLELPVAVGNDVDVATWGEWRHGAGRDVDHVLGVFVGTGLGTGAISGGRLVEGCRSSALEFGHVTLVEGGRDCTCPSRGCIEAYVGGWAIGKRAREAVEQDPDAGRAFLERAGSVDRITARHVDELFEQDHPLARRLVKETGRYLGAGLASMVNVFAPCVIVLGGGVIDGMPELIDLARSELENRPFEVYVENTELRRAELGEKAPVIGAAVMARDELLEI